MPSLKVESIFDRDGIAGQMLVLHKLHAALSQMSQFGVAIYGAVE